MTLRILVVDDERDAVLSLMLLLGDEGYEVKGATNGQEMWRCFASFRPDAILLDIGLPDGDGYELARQLHRHFGERCPLLIAVTARAKESDRALAELVGFRHYMRKPYDPLALIGLLSTVRPGRRPSEVPAP